MSHTLKDVARLAGVSSATASRVINQAGNVAVDTKIKILSAISTLKYSPDVNAVELRRSKRRHSENSGTRATSPDRTKAERRSDSESNAYRNWRKTERLRLLEVENVRLKRLVTKLSMDVEMWRKIAE